MNYILSQEFSWHAVLASEYVVGGRMFVKTTSRSWCSVLVGASLLNMKYFRSKQSVKNNVMSVLVIGI